MREQDPPLVELAGSILAANGDTDEINRVIAEFEMNHMVMARTAFNTYMEAVARRNAEYKTENSTLRQLLNLPDLDSVDAADMNDITYATEDDL